MSNRPLPPGIKRYSEKAKKVFEGIRFEIYQWEQELFDGSKSTFEVAKRADTVVVIPVIGDEIILVNEKQPHWDKEGLTLVAGMVNPEEDLRDAAKRELLEETGMVFDNFHLVYIEPIVPAVEWTAYTLIATGYQTTLDKKLDAGEKNEIVKINFDKLIELARKQSLVYPPRFVESYLIRDKLDELRDVLKNPSNHSIKI
jgi:8-oxo-dGTP pyrophosphatase MutT (NUDIX family)